MLAQQEKIRKMEFELQKNSIKPIKGLRKTVFKEMSDQEFDASQFTLSQYSRSMSQISRDSTVSKKKKRAAPKLNKIQPLNST